MSRLALLTLAFLAGGCTSFTVPGYRGRAVEYVARPGTDGSAEPASPRLVQTEGVRIVFYPFQSAWLPSVDLWLPGQHESFLGGWIWIENLSPTPVRVVAAYLRTPAGVPLPTRVNGVHSAIEPAEGLWIHASTPIDRDFAERFELWFGWREGEQEHGIPVAYARQEP